MNIGAPSANAVGGVTPPTPASDPEPQDERTGYYPVPGFPVLRLKISGEGTVTPPAAPAPPEAE